LSQGENIQPFFFSLYLNDLEQFLDENNAIGLISLTEDLEQELDTYLKLFILLYADDTVILAESSDDMLPFLNTSYMALIPLFTSSFFAILNDHVFENTINSLSL
jgi:hypothetical protein